MTSLIRFTPLNGAWNENPLCYLLQIDECTILLDCGWTDAFRVEDLEVLQRYVYARRFEFLVDIAKFIFQ